MKKSLTVKEMVESQRFIIDILRNDDKMKNNEYLKRVNLTNLLLLYITDNYLKNNSIDKRQRKVCRKIMVDMSIQSQKIKIDSIYEKKIIFKRYEDLYKLFSRPYLLKTLISEDKEVFSYDILNRMKDRLQKEDDISIDFNKKLADFVISRLPDHDVYPDSFEQESSLYYDLYAKLAILNIMSSDNVTKDNYEEFKNDILSLKYMMENKFTIFYDEAIDYIKYRSIELYKELLKRTEDIASYIISLDKLVKTLDLNDTKTYKDMVNNNSEKFGILDIVEEAIVFVLFESYKNSK
nr:MAG TPA: hypothetical protein [Caudoviricetes sp.]